MMLGIVLHSSQVFNPEKTWSIYSANTNPAFTYLVELIHLFRMPAFFIISGYFCLLTINRYGPRKFLNIRLKRIIIPLITTAIILNSLQTFILYKTGWFNFDLKEYLYTSIWIGHLWFLVDLIIYFILALILASYFRSFFIRINDLINKYLTQLPFVFIVFLLPLLWLSIKTAGKLGIPIYWNFLNIFNLHELLLYVPYFIFGIWLRANPEQLIRFSTISLRISTPIVIASIFIYHNTENSSNTINIILFEYFHTLSIWFSASICFNLFMRFFNTHSKLLAFISDASYTVYLFHHIFIISIGLIIINNDIDYLLGFPTLILLTLVITFSLHKYVILPNIILRYIFNGK